MMPNEILSSQLGLIQDVIRFVCRRKRLVHEDAEDFSSFVHLKLLENDHAILRKWEGRSSLRTYLTTVIIRLSLDWRIKKWGKWRPSAAAKRLGDLAIQLEQLCYRDRHSAHEAIEILRTNHGLSISDSEAESILAQIPQRHPRRFPDEGTVAEIIDARPRGDRALELRQASVRAGETVAALADALATLPTEDRIIVKLRFMEDFPVVEIAKLMGLESKRLYRRIGGILKRLRTQLESVGVRREELDDILAGLDAGMAGDSRVTDRSEHVGMDAIRAILGKESED